MAMLPILLNAFGTPDRQPSLLLFLLLVPTLQRPRRSILLPLQRAEGMRKAGLLDGDRRGRVDNLRGGIRRQVRLLYHLHRSHLRLVLLLGIRVGIWKSTNPSLHQRLYRRNRMVRMRLGLLLPSSLAPHPVLGRGVQRSLSKQRKARAWCTTNLCTDSGIYCIT